MKIAAFSDVHSNWPALQAVLTDIRNWGDNVQIVVAGDFLNLGPFPRQTLQTLRSLPNAIIIAGNHEEYILEQAQAVAQNETLEPPYRAMYSPSRWTYQQLNSAEIKWLEELPRQAQLEGPDGTDIKIVHGSPREQTEGLRQDLSESQLTEIFVGEIKPRRLWISGHIHRPTLILWQGMTITSNGAVGAPLDNDTRACYLRAEWDEAAHDWRAEHRRIVYDREQTLTAMQEIAAYDQAGPFIHLAAYIIRNGRESYISRFLADYKTVGEFPPPPHDLEHLEKAIMAHLATLP